MGLRPDRRRRARSPTEVGGAPSGQEGLTDFAKIDAALASALEGQADQDARVLPVFVGVVADLPDAATAVLARIGAGVPSGGVVTAVLSARQVSDLSECPWVRYLRLSGRLDLLEP